MSNIHLLISSYGDCLFEYPRFFAANHKLLKKHGIAMPWLEKDGQGLRWQPYLSRHLAQLDGRDREKKKYLAHELEGMQKILLCGPPGNFWDISRLKEFLSDIPGWKDIKIHLLWLPVPKALDIEGYYRQNTGKVAESALRAQLKNDPEDWFNNLEKLFRQADTVKIMPDVSNGHLSSAVLTEAMLVPPIEGLEEQIEDFRLNSSLLNFAEDKLESLLLLNKKTLFDILKPHDASNLEPLLPAELLNEYDKKYNPGLERLAAKFGCQLHFSDSFPFEGNWPEARENDPAAWRKIGELALQKLPPKKAIIAKRIFTQAPQLLWPGFERLESGAPALELDVLTLAKNQEKYILECMESVTMQKTSFPVRHIIVDDGSDDQTTAIIMDYAQSHSNVYPLLLKRPRPAGDNVRCLFEACRSRYAALCDGDDYFTDPLKLQKQVDFLEKNPDFAISFHPVKVTYEDDRPTRIYPDLTMMPKGPKDFYSINDLFGVNFIQTNSVVYRWRFKDGLPPWFAADLVPGDWYWHLLHAEKGLIGYMPDTMAVYRRHAASLYATAEIDQVLHREKHGMKELRVYDVLDRHFRRKFHPDLARLANGVLADFLRLYVDSGDDSALAAACEKYPVFGRDFLRDLKIVSHKNNDPGCLPE